MATKKLVTMDYVDYKILTIAGDAGLQQGDSTTWVANSPWDPSKAASGTFNTAAAGLAFYTGLYSHYEVVSAKIVIKLSQMRPITTAEGFQPLKVMLKLDDGGAITGGSWSKLMLDPNTVMKTLHWNANGTATVKITKTFTRKFLQSTPESRGAAMNADPVDKAYFVLAWQWASQTGQAGTPPTLNCDVHLRQRVLLTENNDITNNTLAMTQN